MPYHPPMPMREDSSFEPKAFHSLLKRYYENTKRPEFQKFLELHQEKYFIDIRRDVGLSALCADQNTEEICRNTWEWYKYWIPVMGLGRTYWSDGKAGPNIDIIQWTEAVMDLMNEFLRDFPGERCWNPDWDGRLISAELLRAPPSKSHHTAKVFKI